MKKLIFDLLTSSPRVAGGGGASKNICYHAAAFVIPFNLILQLDILLKK